VALGDQEPAEGCFVAVFDDAEAFPGLAVHHHRHVAMTPPETVGVVH
jgi:hypothetical protein